MILSSLCRINVHRNNKYPIPKPLMDKRLVQHVDVRQPHLAHENEPVEKLLY
jgi:hypothetical protein